MLPVAAPALNSRKVAFGGEVPDADEAVTLVIAGACAPPWAPVNALLPAPDGLPMPSPARCDFRSMNSPVFPPPRLRPITAPFGDGPRLSIASPTPFGPPAPLLEMTFSAALSPAPTPPMTAPLVFGPRWIPRRSFGRAEPSVPRPSVFP